MLVVVTLYVSNNKKMNINETQSKLHSIGPKLKSNLVDDFDVRARKHVRCCVTTVGWYGITTALINKMK